MNRLQTLFFPETNTPNTFAHELLLICDTLSCYQFPPPVETDQTRQDLKEKGLCTGYNPIAFTDEEETRFTRLIKDLKGNEEEFYGGYLASFSMGRQDPDEASVRALISSMATGHQQEQADKAEKEKLWQAMLLLKLAEVLTREEEEITQGLSAISASEKSFLSDLKGLEDDEEELDFTHNANLTINRPTLNFEKLTRAWAKVFTQDTRAGDTLFLATNRIESHLLLADIYETRTGTTPRQVLKIELPDLENIDQETFIKMREQIKNTAEEALTSLTKLMGQQKAGNALTDGAIANFQEIEPQINGAISPLAGNSPRSKNLTFYAYEMVSLKELCSSLIHPETTAENNNQADTIFLAVLGS